MCDRTTVPGGQLISQYRGMTAGASVTANGNYLFLLEFNGNSQILKTQ